MQISMPNSFCLKSFCRFSFKIWSCSHQNRRYLDWHYEL